MNAIALSLVAFSATLVGGLLALRYRDNLHRLLGFTAGILLGTIAFELLPEIFELSKDNGIDPVGPMIALVAGFFVFHVLEKTLMPHAAHEHEYGEHRHPKVGVFSALGLIGHSYLDGLGIGLSFLVSPAVGLATAIAVIGHDFSDGLNTVSLLLVNKNSDRRAKALLLLDACAPILGAATAAFITVPTEYLVLYLGFFAGFLLYLATADILPEAHSKHPSFWTFAATFVGVIFALIVSRLIA